MRTSRLFLAFLLAAFEGAFGQALLVDRAPLSNPGAALKLGVSKGFLGDHFELGARGEVWVIDSLAVWAIAGRGAGSTQRLGDLFESVKLFGGIEAPLPPPDQPPQPDCACHNLVVLKSQKLLPGKDSPEQGGIRISAVAAGVWRVDFEDLKWSVPGGTPLQFGVLGTSRRASPGASRHTWSNAAGTSEVLHDIRLFDEDGKLLGHPEGPPLDPSIGMHLQVRGHKSAI